MLINACQIFLMFRYYAYGEKYVELVQFWLNFLEERRLVAWGRGTKVASVFFFFWRETVERILTVHQILQACVMLINACQIFLMFRYYAYGEKYFELVQFWLNFLEERRLVAWGRGAKVASVFFFFWRETVERILTVHQILQACVMLINACQIFLMFRYYAYGEKYVELVQFWLNFLEERRLVAWGRGAKVASVFFFFLERNGRTDSYGSWIN
jgi:hypothetical protein